MLKQVKVEVTARHIHLSREDLDKLFGKGFELSFFKDLSQPGQFASNEKVSIVSKDGRIDNVRVLGPVRPESQIEISQTDARFLKISAPLRLSGDLDGSSPIRLIGPNGSVDLEKGVIISKRHFHCTLETSNELNLKNGDVVKVKVGEDGLRGLIFDNIEVRVSDKFSDAIHIDTDEGNACSIGGICSIGEILN